FRLRLAVIIRQRDTRRARRLGLDAHVRPRKPIGQFDSRCRRTSWSISQPVSPWNAIRASLRGMFGNRCLMSGLVQSTLPPAQVFAGILSDRAPAEFAQGDPGTRQTQRLTPESAVPRTRDQNTYRPPPPR